MYVKDKRHRDLEKTFLSIQKSHILLLISQKGKQ